MRITRTALPEVLLIEPEVHGDQRGFFVELWRRDSYAFAGIDVDFVQDNMSRSKRGTLRGLHYQLRRTQGKLVRVVAGEVFDVAVDVRRSSPTFGRWAGVALSSVTQQCLWIPAGYAHGFLVLSESADFLYKCTDFYDPESERSVRWNDPALGVEWPLASGIEPLLSARDASAPLLADAETLP
jgi:dTDP-4-dehydrorhamnose 3,5-epimerase